MQNIFIIAGLGNPGGKYTFTRHNAGFLTIDFLSSSHGIKVNKLKFKALCGEGSISGKRVLLAKPRTFMNLSGESIREMTEWYKIPPENLIIIYDDVDLEPGTIRVRPGGSSGSHNGMKSIIYQLQYDNFPRIRIGIGRQPENYDLAGFVLGTPGGDERQLLEKALKQAAEATEKIISDGVEAAMRQFNIKKKPPAETIESKPAKIVDTISESISAVLEVKNHK